MTEPLTYPNTVQPLAAVPAAAVRAEGPPGGRGGGPGTFAATATANPIPGSVAVHDRDGADAGACCWC